MSPQKQQEQVSRGQLREALAGWVCNSLGDDFGEDFFVSIYDDGRSTGLSFQLQLKSTTNISDFAPKRAPSEIRYTLDVVDLEHWEDASPPVVVVIWDVTRREGCWTDVPQAIEELTKKSPRWRDRKTATVSIPLAQRLDAAGRHALRQRVGRLVLPALSKGKTLEIKPRFSFPNTPEGRAAHDALRRAIEDGEKVTVEAENIEHCNMSPWWDRIFGSISPAELTISPGTSDVRFTLNLEAVGDSEVERIPVEMRRIKAGTRRATFANACDDDAAQLALQIDSHANSIHLQASLQHPHASVSQGLPVTRALRVVRGGGHLRVALPNGTPLGAFRMDPQRLPPEKELRVWERLLTMLAIVQGRTARYGLFTIRSPVTSEDLENANRLRLICSKGEEDRRMTLAMTMAAPPELPADVQGTPGDIAFEIDPFGDIKLFGVTVPCGKVREESSAGRQRCQPASACRSR